MLITSVLSEDETTLSIAIEGRFDYASHQEFSEAYEKQGRQILEYIIDMTHVNYLDSSALGMLLVLKNYSPEAAVISVRNCTDNVKNILEISNFKRFFIID